MTNFQTNVPSDAAAALPLPDHADAALQGSSLRKTSTTKKDGEKYTSSVGPLNKNCVEILISIVSDLNLRDEELSFDRLKKKAVLADTLRDMEECQDLEIHHSESCDLHDLLVASGYISDETINKIFDKLRQNKETDQLIQVCNANTECLGGKFL